MTFLLYWLAASGYDNCQLFDTVHHAYHPVVFNLLLDNFWTQTKITDDPAVEWVVVQCGGTVV